MQSVPMVTAAERKKGEKLSSRCVFISRKLTLNHKGSRLSKMEKSRHTWSRKRIETWNCLVTLRPWFVALLPQYVFSLNFLVTFHTKECDKTNWYSASQKQAKYKSPVQIATHVNLYLDWWCTEEENVLPWAFLMIRNLLKTSSLRKASLFYNQNKNICCSTWLKIRPVLFNRKLCKPIKIHGPEYGNRMLSRQKMSNTKRFLE